MMVSEGNWKALTISNIVAGYECDVHKSTK